MDCSCASQEFSIFVLYYYLGHLGAQGDGALALSGQPNEGWSVLFLLLSSDLGVHFSSVVLGCQCVQRSVTRLFFSWHFWLPLLRSLSLASLSAAGVTALFNIVIVTITPAITNDWNLFIASKPSNFWFLSNTWGELHNECNTGFPAHLG